MKGLLADFVHAVRHYLSTPVSSAIAVLVLAVAVAVLTAFLALWDEVARAPHSGFERSDQLVTIVVNDNRRMFGLPNELLERLNEEATTIRAIAGVAATVQNTEWTEDGVPRQADLATEYVTERYFPDIRPRVQLGRPFDAADHAVLAEPVVIISDALWERLYDRRTDVLGETLRMRGTISLLQGSDADQVRDHRIIGVLAPAVTSTFIPFDVDLWMPYEPIIGRGLAELGITSAESSALQSVARAAPGVSVQAIRNELRTRFGDAEGLAVSTAPDARLDAMAGIVSDFGQQRDTLRQVRLFTAGGLLLALVAACNSSLFLLSRGPGRRRELAIRLAVGARFRRLARQLVTEVGMLVAAATVLGLFLSLWLTVVLSDLPFIAQLQRMDASPFAWRVLGMVAGLALLLMMFVSVAPLIGLKRLGIAAGGVQATARAGWAQRLAGTAQISVGTVVGGAAFAFVWYLGELAAVDPGFSAADVQFVQLSQEDPLPPDASDQALLEERAQRRAMLSALPGVQDVAFGTTVPGRPRVGEWVLLAVPDAPQDTFPVNAHNVDADYFALLGATLLDGRFLNDGDLDGVVINETLARSLWGRVDVVGRLLPLDGSSEARPRREVVGVVRDIAFEHPAADPQPMMFEVSPATGIGVALLRTVRSAVAIQDALQERIEEGQLGYGNLRVRAVEDLWHETMAPERARTTLTAATALIVVLLAAFGTYGTQRYLVQAGRREYALLAALGAGPRALGRLVLARSLRLGLPGMVLGALLAFSTVVWMRDEYVSSSVPPGAITVLILLAIAGLLLLATIGPASEARNTQPGPLLKEE